MEDLAAGDASGCSNCLNMCGSGCAGAFFASKNGSLCFAGLGRSALCSVALTFGHCLRLPAASERRGLACGA